MGFPRWVKTVKTIAKQSGSGISFFANEKTIEAIQFMVKSTRPQVEAEYKEFSNWDDFLILAREVTPNDLFIVVNARHQTISYNPSLDNVPRSLSRHFEDTSFIILYPEQYTPHVFDSTLFNV